MSAKHSDLPNYAICSPEEAKEYAELTRQGQWGLLSYEIFWRDRYYFLEGRGYILRPRFRPDWIPSWLGTNREPDFCEDSIRSVKYQVMDAIKKSDGTQVSLKTVSKHNNEISIARFVSSPERLQDPTNHCVPIFDVFDDPLDSSQAFIVMPYLRPFDNPEFRTIGEVIDFVYQTLEGLCVMHHLCVAHRDCAAANIMMDGRPLFPQGHHPVRLDYTADGVFDAPCLSRQDHPVRYYFIDFGISSRFKRGEIPLVIGTKGRDKEPPEMSDTHPYNPFPLDIFVLGNVYLKEFVQKYHGLEFLGTLITAMVQPQPERRPTAMSALQIFQDIRSGVPDSTLRWRLRPREESTPARVVYDTVAVAREGIYRLKRLMS
ncbi:unnamed protein product [Somion occarium]|uniref:Protein kinase domain-containing protein n=1 Tax=Somion occarium TaxID=3059160 RepID=A0ABP1DVN3_9APHY